MKLSSSLPLFVALLAASLVARAQTGGPYSLASAVISTGGGEASGGGRYSLVGTVDQPAVASSTAGRYELAAGFWTPLTVLQTPDAPRLFIEILPDGLVRLRWAATKAAFILEGTASLTAPEWQGWPLRPVTDGVTFSVVVPPAEPLRCFRLRPAP